MSFAARIAGAGLERNADGIASGRRAMRGARCAAQLLIWLALLPAPRCAGQNSPSSGGGQSGMHGLHSVQGVDQTMTDDPVFQERRLRMLKEAQHKSMVADTDKLLRLAAELNAEIARTGPASLSSEQLRKVAEIEKLARGVKDKMRTTVQGGPGLLDLSTPMPPSLHGLQ